jgi:hypothetical protein
MKSMEGITYGELKHILTLILDRIAPCNNDEIVSAEVLDAIIQAMMSGSIETSSMTSFLCSGMC